MPTVGRERENIVVCFCWHVQGEAFYFLKPRSTTIYTNMFFEKLSLCKSSSFVFQRVSFIGLFGIKWKFIS